MSEGPPGLRSVTTGEALYEGVELQGRIDMGRMFDSVHNPYLELSYTALPTADQVCVTVFHLAMFLTGRSPALLNSPAT